MFGLGLTLLQKYWAVRLAVVSAKLIRHVLSGTFYDKTHGERNPDAPFGIFQFKKRFAQYYFVGLLGSLWVTWNLIWSCAGYGVSDRFTHALEYFTSPGTGLTDPLHAMIVASLYTFHLGRRYYESLSVSIFSGRQILNIFDVAFYLTDFVASAMSIAADTPTVDTNCFSLAHLSWRPLLAIPLFIFATRLQHSSHLRLAKLRKNRAGHVVTTAYKMPNDHWFEKVSGPHYLAKVLIYISLGIMLGTGSNTWCWLTAYVITNQVYLAHGTHNYYINKFENYPKNRKMMIPYLL